MQEEVGGEEMCPGWWGELGEAQKWGGCGTVEAEDCTSWLEARCLWGHCGLELDLGGRVGIYEEPCKPWEKIPEGRVTVPSVEGERLQGAIRCVSLKIFLARKSPHRVSGRGWGSTNPAEVPFIPIRKK